MSQVDHNEQTNENEEEEVRSKETSILFEPLSLGILFICLLGAIWFKFLPLIVVSTFLLILSLLIFIWKRRSLKNVQPTFDVPSTRVFAGETFLVHASLKNDKWLPLIWLEWEFAKSKLVRWGSDLKDTQVFRFLWLLWFQKIEWTVTGKALHRGIYQIGEITLRSGDGFRFSEEEKLYQLSSELYIYPKLVPVRVPSFRTSLQWEAKGRQGGFVEDPLLINGIRDYEAGDEWQRFNWRASARIGKLQTNVYQPVVSEQLMTFVDVGGFVIDHEKYATEPLKQQKYEQEKKEAFEKMLSVVASFAMEYNERQIKVGFASNGLDLRKKMLQSVSPSIQLTPYLDQLARMTQRVVGRSRSSLDKLLYEGSVSCPLYIFCENVTKDHVRWYRQNEHAIDAHFYYMVSNSHAVTLGQAAKPIDTLLGEAAVSHS